MTSFYEDFQVGTIDQVMKTNLAGWVLAIATAIGAWGGFPAAPQWFVDLTDPAGTPNELFQYVLVFLLIYQGGGGRSMLFSLIMTIIVYLVAKFT